jgi:hypothetical protein
MELTEEMRYRLSYLALRLLCDAKLERDFRKEDLKEVLALLDLLTGSKLAVESSAAEGRSYLSQREKLEDFIDAEFGEEALETVRGAVAKLIS